MVILEDGGWELRRYWRPQYREALDIPEDELIDRIRGVLRRSVERRTTPGAPTGVLMSGGLDSTSVAVLAQKSPDGAIGFSTTFPDYPHIDESVWIDALESYAGLPGVHLAAKGSGILASGLEYLSHWELPLSAWNEAWTQPLLRQAPGLGVSAILSGEGGDELFGSRFLFTADLMRRGRLLAAFNFARGLPEAGGRAPRDVLAHVLWKFGLQGVPPAWLESIWRSAAVWDDPAPWWANRETAERLRRSRPPSWRGADGPRWWAFLTDALTTGVHGFGLFDHVRRRTEQLGLEARHPLFDLELFDLMLQIPPERFSEGDLNRPLFREAMAGLSPDEVRLRRDKSVFNDLIVDALVGPELPALDQIPRWGHGAERLRRPRQDRRIAREPAAGTARLCLRVGAGRIAPDRDRDLAPLPGGPSPARATRRRPDPGASRARDRASRRLPERELVPFSSYDLFPPCAPARTRLPWPGGKKILSTTTVPRGGEYMTAKFEYGKPEIADYGSIQEMTAGCNGDSR